MGTLSVFPNTIAMFRLIPLVAAALSLASPLAAQPRPALGNWAIEWELGRRIMNDDVQVIKATGTLTLAVSGDSVLATVTVQSRADGMPAPKPLTVGARLTADGATFTQVQQVRINMNGEESTRESTATWTLKVTGDTLSGGIVREVPGMPEVGAPAVVTGTRIRP